jgi:hypothetical protein
MMIGSESVRFVAARGHLPRKDNRRDNEGEAGRVWHRKVELTNAQ